jgi:hypothetical protein
MKSHNQVILIIFIITVFYLIRHTKNIEQFKERKRHRKRRSKEDYKNGNKKKKDKEDYQSLGITDTIDNILNIGSNKTVEEQDKYIFRQNMNKRRIKRRKLLKGKTSKNITDSIEKFNALKEGFYDIINYGIM